MDRRQLGDLIRSYRLALPDPSDPEQPLSIRRLAKLTGKNHATIKRIEEGDRGVSGELAASLDTALQANGEIAAAAAAVPALPGRWPQVVAQQLPPEPTPLVGREAARAELVDYSHTYRSHSQPPVLTLSGAGGIGKTALAVAVAHQLTPEHPGGALFADLRGWDAEAEPLPLAGVLQRWCRALGAPAHALGGDLDELIGVWRTQTFGRSLVVVIDNAREEQIAPLIPASPASTILVTTRDRIVSTSGVLQYHVPPLTDADASHLLARHAGMTEASVAPLVPRCGGFPLALRVAGEDARHHWDEESIGDMASAYDVADEVTAIDRSARLSYGQLSTRAQRAWRLCALTSGRITLGQAAAMVGADHRTTRRLLTEAVDAYLLDRVGGAWVYADPHRDFARRESHRCDATEQQDAAVYRGLTWLLHGLARAAYHVAGRDDTPLDLVAHPEDVTPPTISDYSEAMAWCEAHWYHSPEPIHAAIDRGWSTLAWQLVATGLNYVFLAKPLASWDVAARDALDAAHKADDIAGQAFMHIARGSVAGDRGDLPRAVRHLRTSLDLRRTLGHRHARDIGWSAINTARWLFAQDAPDDEIIPLLDEAISEHGSINYPAGVVLGNGFYGGLALRRGDHAEADRLLAGAYERTPEVGDPAITVFLGTLWAEALYHLDRCDEAADLARHADQLAHDSNAESWRIGALSTLASCVDSDEAQHCLRLAISIAEALDDPREDELRDRLAPA